MMVVFYSVVRRYMKHTSPGSFTRFVPGLECPVPLVLETNEELVGWYRNPAPFETSIVVFTSNALVLSNDRRIDRIGISEIVACEPPASKTDATGLRIRTRIGFRFVRIAGSFGPAGNQKDVFSFFSVMRAVVRSI